MLNYRESKVERKTGHMGQRGVCEAEGRAAIQVRNCYAAEATRPQHSARMRAVGGGGGQPRNTMQRDPATPESVK